MSVIAFNDYTPLSNVSLVFSRGGDSRDCSTNITLIDDDSIEGTESIIVRMSSMLPRVSVDSTNLLIQLLDNDGMISLYILVSVCVCIPIVVSVGVIGPLSGVDEGNGSVSVSVVVISGKLETPINLLINTVDGTATGIYHCSDVSYNVYCIYI